MGDIRNERAWIDFLLCGFWGLEYVKEGSGAEESGVETTGPPSELEPYRVRFSLSAAANLERTDLNFEPKASSFLCGTISGRKELDRLSKALLQRSTVSGAASFPPFSDVVPDIFKLETQNYPNLLPLDLPPSQLRPTPTASQTTFQSLHGDFETFLSSPRLLENPSHLSTLPIENLNKRKLSDSSVPAAVIPLRATRATARGTSVVAVKKSERRSKVANEARVVDERESLREGKRRRITPASSGVDVQLEEEEAENEAGERKDASETDPWMNSLEKDVLGSSAVPTPHAFSTSAAAERHRRAEASGSQGALRDKKKSDKIKDSIAWRNEQEAVGKARDNEIQLLLDAPDASFTSNFDRLIKVINTQLAFDSHVQLVVSDVWPRFLQLNPPFVDAFLDSARRGHRFDPSDHPLVYQEDFVGIKGPDHHGDTSQYLRVWETSPKILGEWYEQMEDRYPAVGARLHRSCRLLEMELEKVPILPGGKEVYKMEAGIETRASKATLSTLSLPMASVPAPPPPSTSSNPVARPSSPITSDPAHSSLPIRSGNHFPFEPPRKRQRIDSRPSGLAEPGVTSKELLVVKVSYAGKSGRGNGIDRVKDDAARAKDSFYSDFVKWNNLPSEVGRFKGGRFRCFSLRLPSRLTEYDGPRFGDVVGDQIEMTHIAAQRLSSLNSAIGGDGRSWAPSQRLVDLRDNCESIDSILESLRDKINLIPTRPSRAPSYYRNRLPFPSPSVPPSEIPIPLLNPAIPISDVPPFDPPFVLAQHTSFESDVDVSHLPSQASLEESRGIIRAQIKAAFDDQVAHHAKTSDEATKSISTIGFQNVVFGGSAFTMTEDGHVRGERILDEITEGDFKGTSSIFGEDAGDGPRSHRSILVFARKLDKEYLTAAPPSLRQLDSISTAFGSYTDLWPATRDRLDLPEATLFTLRQLVIKDVTGVMLTSAHVSAPSC